MRHGRDHQGRDDARAALVIDVDRFRLVNDSLGAAAGDALLVALADRLAAALAPGDILVRLGGDEFAVLLRDAGGSAAAAAVAERIQLELARPFVVAGHELFVSLSIGIAHRRARQAPADLVDDAGIAMDAAKRRGRGRSTVFEPGMRRRARERLILESELRKLIDGAHMAIHYQPIVSLRSGEIHGLEALARWPDGRPAVPPAEFISIAEDTGIIGALGRHVLQTALHSLAGWRRAGLIGDDVGMSVNLSGRQLDDPSLAAQACRALAAAELPASVLKFEITESTLVAETEGTERVLADVCAQGVGLHLDDFGTGYSSLSALHRLPVEALKIDRSFVSDLDAAAPGSQAIVRSTIAMARGLGLSVIAEGIETAAQLARLRSLGCDFGQGHLFSPALSAEAMRGWLGQRAPAPVPVAA